MEFPTDFPGRRGETDFRWILQIQINLEAFISTSICRRRILLPSKLFEKNIFMLWYIKFRIKLSTPFIMITYNKFHHNSKKCTKQNCHFCVKSLNRDISF